MTLSITMTLFLMNYFLELKKWLGVGPVRSALSSAKTTGVFADARAEDSDFAKNFKS